jgi:hypothetical protein
MTPREREAVEKMITYVKEGTDLLIQQVNLIKVASPYYEVYQQAITETLANMAESMNMVSDYLGLDEPVVEPQPPFEEQPVQEEKEEAPTKETKGSDNDVDSNNPLINPLAYFLKMMLGGNEIDSLKRPTAEDIAKSKRLTKDEFKKDLEIKMGEPFYDNRPTLHNWKNAVSIVYPCGFSYKGKVLGEVFFNLAVNTIDGFIHIMMVDEDNNPSTLYHQETEPKKNGYKPLSELYNKGQIQLLETIQTVAWNRFNSSRE